MSTSIEGGCACGAVRYRLASEPLFTQARHDSGLVYSSGGAFVVNLLIEADRVELLRGEPAPVDVPRDDGSAQTVFRCPDCQVAVYSRYGHPGISFVRGGTLDEPARFPPNVHIFTRSKVAWVALPDETPAVEVYYDMQELWPAASLERFAALTSAGG